MSFTPGPWKVRESYADRTFTHISSATDDAVACTRTEANATLIAAAPDLLEALQELVGWVPGAEAWHTDAPIKAVEKARAAIAKAKP